MYFLKIDLKSEKVAKTKKSTKNLVKNYFITFDILIYFSKFFYSISLKFQKEFLISL